MAELDDYCQCCAKRLADDYLNYRCKDCLDGYHCPACTKCRKHCEGHRKRVEEA